MMLHKDLDFDSAVLGEVVVVRLKHYLRVVVVQYLEECVLQLLEFLVIKVVEEPCATRHDHVRRDEGVQVGISVVMVDAKDVRFEHVDTGGVKAREQLALDAHFVRRSNANDEALSLVFVLGVLQLTGLELREIDAADSARADHGRRLRVNAEGPVKTHRRDDGRQHERPHDRCVNLRRQHGLAGRALLVGCGFRQRRHQIAHLASHDHCHPHEKLLRLRVQVLGDPRRIARALLELLVLEGHVRKCARDNLGADARTKSEEDSVAERLALQHV
mmetsp:Transcript_20180/g.34345  ORF Transcript_20180/g.34345 Transcript_20180/m.34345 type:complete len:274 (-) Transcript_20180:1198-2019(-)